MTAGIPEDFLTIPLGRGAEPAEVSAMVVFLASGASSYCTGSEFIVDGGLLSRVRTAPRETSPANGASLHCAGVLPSGVCGDYAAVAERGAEFDVLNDDNRGWWRIGRADSGPRLR
jgi:hypothetical protein